MPEEMNLAEKYAELKRLQKEHGFVSGPLPNFLFVDGFKFGRDITTEELLDYSLSATHKMIEMSEMADMGMPYVPEELCNPDSELSEEERGKLWDDYSAEVAAVRKKLQDMKAKENTAL